MYTPNHVDHQGLLKYNPNSFLFSHTEYSISFGILSTQLL